jgi:transmembrane sensor
MAPFPVQSDAVPTPPSWDEVAAFLAGELARDRAQAVSTWLSEHGQDAALVAALGASVERYGAERAREVESDVEVEVALARVRSSMLRPAPRVGRGATPGKTQEARPRPTWRLSSPWLRAAAAVAVAVGAIWWSWAHNAPPGTMEAREIAAGVGEVRRVTLPDSSEVLLAPGTRLIVDAGFGGRARGVTIPAEGEARFVVRHDAGRPFVVRAGQAIVRDLGTVFVVRRGPDGSARVVVSEGSVRLARVGADTGAVVLAAGDAGELTGAGISHRADGVADADTAWAAGRLVFADAPMTEVTRAIERWYGVTVLLADNAATRRFSGVLSTESRQRAIELLALTLGARASWQGDTVTLRDSVR